MFLLDTNVWLELLLEQKDAEQVRRLLESEESERFALTDFSLHSLGVILMRLKKESVFLDFLSDTLEESGLRLVRLDAADLKRVHGICGKFRLDFDDAYQYLAAEKHEMVLVSFDSDFDRTERGRRVPATATEPEH